MRGRLRRGPLPSLDEVFSGPTGKILEFIRRVRRSEPPLDQPRLTRLRTRPRDVRRKKKTVWNKMVDARNHFPSIRSSQPRTRLLILLGLEHRLSAADRDIATNAGHFHRLGLAACPTCTELDSAAHLLTACPAYDTALENLSRLVVRPWRSSGDDPRFIACR